MFRLNRVAVRRVVAEVAVNRMQVQAVFARQERERHLKIRAQLGGRPRPAGIRPGDGEPAAHRVTAALETPDIVALPALQ